MLRWAFALAVWIAVPAGHGTARAAEQCEHATALLAAADMLLQEPAELPRFWRDRYGHDAAYLAIRHRGLDAGVAEAMLNRLTARAKPPERILELRLAHALPDARQALIAQIEPSPRDGSVVPLLGASAWRALVVEDGGAWLVDEIARWRNARPDAAGLASVTTSIARAIADVDDATKQDFARRAEAGGLWMLAFMVLALRDDLTELMALLDRFPADAMGSTPPAEFRKAMVRQALQLAEMRDGFDLEGQPMAVKVADTTRPYGAGYRALYRLATRDPQAALLFTVVNQTGELRIASELAPSLLDDIAAGRLDPVSDPDSSLAAMIDGVDAVLGRAVREGTLASFSVTSASGLQGAVAGDHVDAVLARRALAPLVRGEAAEPPARPAAITARFDWAGTSRIAVALATGTPIEDGDRLAAADLMVGAGRFDAAIALLGTASDFQRARVATAATMMMLDRRCGDLLAPTLPMLEPLFRFAPR